MVGNGISEPSTVWMMYGIMDDMYFEQLPSLDIISRQYWSVVKGVCVNEIHVHKSWKNG